MIIQNAVSNQLDMQSQFVIKNIEHAALVAQLAENFGNENFASPEPNDEILYLAAHHDHGWESLDENPPINAETGLPYNLVKTPFDFILKTSKGSPDFNEKHSPFCGLISSMHTYGLFNGRYGLSDAINMDWVPEASRGDVDLMLADELARQSRLRSELKNSPLDDENLIFRAYKFLQFIDACALYFNMNPEGQRGEKRFLNVPRSASEDCDIEVSETQSGDYHFKPYPFKTRKFTLYFEGRYLTPGAALDSVPSQRQYINISAEAE